MLSCVWLKVAAYFSYSLGYFSFIVCLFCILHPNHALMKNRFYQLSIFFFLFFIIPLQVFAQTPGGIGAVLMLDTAKNGSTMPRIKNLIAGSPAAAQHLPEGV